MRIITIFILMLPIFLFSQESEKGNTKKKVDGNSKAANYIEIKGNVSGRILTAEDNIALEYASISITNTKNNQLIEGTITNNKGRFLFEDIKIGEYKLSISFMGFDNKEIEFSTTESNADFNDDNIKVYSNSKILSEVNIEEEKAIYETKIDKIIYNAENDLNGTENDATDVLRKAPLLSVDIEGNISLRGSRNIKFLVNGKASTFFSNDISSALQMIPASEIKSIEVITTPGSKYDGDGDAGIVNIITKRKKIDGYQATIAGSFGSKTTRSRVNVNFGKERWGFSINGGTWGSGFKKREGIEDFYRLDWDENSDTNRLIKNAITSSYYNGYSGSMNTFYDINTYNSLNSSLSFSGRTKPYDKTENSYKTDSESETDTTISTINKTDRTMNIEWTTDYTKKFKNNEGSELSLAFQIGGDINDGNTSINESINSELRYNQNDEKVIEETFQVDYTYPFGPQSKSEIPKNKQKKPSYGNNREKKERNLSSSASNKIEIGGKIINRDREIMYSDMQANNYTDSEEFNYNQLVSASYISTEFSLPKGIGIKSGVRLENTQTKGNWENNSEIAFKKDYSNLLPNIILSKSFSPMQSIKLSYNERITRPSVRQINTNTNITDNTSTTIGNPKLRATITKKYELSISSYGRFLQGSAQIYRKYSSNVIEPFLEVDSDGVSVSRYKNIGESKKDGFSFFGSINLRKLSFRSGVNIYNYSGRDEQLGYNEWTKAIILYSYNFSGNYSFAEYWKAETFAFFRSPSQSIQGSITSFSMMSIGVKKIFKNKRGSIGIRIIEPFRENKDFTTDLSGEFFNQASVRSIPFRSISITLKYTLGKLNFKDGKKRTSIKNDDIQKDSSEKY